MKPFFVLLVGLLCCCCTSSPQTYGSVEDLQQRKIGVLLGSAQDAYITEHFPQAKVLRIDMTPDLITALNTGACDAVVLDDIQTASILKVYPDLGVLEKNLMESPMGVGFNKECADLCSQFDAFLTRIKADGTCQQIEKRWRIADDQELVEVPDIVLPAQGTPLRVGTTGLCFPFSYVKDEKLVGLDIELITRFAAELGRPIQFQAMNFGGLIPALVSRKVDVIINCIMITPERAKEITFSQPYLLSVAQVVTRKKNLPSPVGYSSLEDLKEKRIAVLMGSTHDAYLTQHYPQVELLRVETESDVILAVQGERADAALLDNVTCQNLMKVYSNTSILEEEVYSESFGIGFSREQLVLRDQFNVFLRQLRESGMYDQIVRRWGDSTTTAQMPVLKIPTEGEPIKVAVTGTMLPYSFVKDGKDVGFDIEILSRFAQEMKRPITFDHISFGGLIAALSANKADIITSAITITPERAKNVNFSDPYFQSKASLIILTKNLTGSRAVDNPSTTQKSFMTRMGDSFYHNIIAERRYLLILSGLKVTLLISVMAALLGTLWGAGICYLRMNKYAVWRMTGKAYINLMRGMPILVLLMLMYYVVFASWDVNATLVAIIAFALNFAAYVSEMFRTSIESIDKGQQEAGIAMGFNKVQTFIYIIMPQAIQNVLPVYKGELISLIKMTSVVGYIAVSDLTKASDIIRSRTFDAFFPLIMVAVFYFLLAWLFTALLDLFNKTRRIGQ